MIQSFCMLFIHYAPLITSLPDIYSVYLLTTWKCSFMISYHKILSESAFLNSLVSLHSCTECRARATTLYKYFKCGNINHLKYSCLKWIYLQRLKTCHGKHREKWRKCTHSKATFCSLPYNFTKQYEVTLGCAVDLSPLISPLHCVLMCQHAFNL